MTNVEALKGVYVSLGGELTDTYPNIADGAPVSDYVIIPDVISAISVKATGAIELPTTTTADNGKLLTVVDGVWNKANAPAELPAVSATDNGDVLTVVDGEWNKAAAPTELPAVSATDNGDVLTVVEGAWAKAAPSVAGRVIYFEATMASNVSRIEYNNFRASDVWNEIVAGNYPIIRGEDGGSIYYFKPEFATSSKVTFAALMDNGVQTNHYQFDVSNNSNTEANYSQRTI